MASKPAPRGAAPGLKLLIGAASLAGTIAGWAALSVGAPPPGEQGPVAAAPAWLLAPPAIPPLPAVAGLAEPALAPAVQPRPAVVARPPVVAVTRSSR